MKIGIIGLGFVGTAIKNAYDLANIEVVCKDPAKGYNCTIEEILDTTAIFICVPSPADSSGRCDTSILYSVLEEIEDYSGIIISKVTAPPDVYQDILVKHPNLVHVPEFLTARFANDDYLNGEFIIIGGNSPFIDSVESIIKLGQKQIKKEHFCKIEEAALIKYSINSFLATKVIFMNQLYNLCKESNVDYNSMSKGMHLDNRLGNSHYEVPGPDGLYGYGGACFPKDTNALKFYSEQLNVDLTILQSAINFNKNLR